MNSHRKAGAHSEIIQSTPGAAWGAGSRAATEIRFSISRTRQATAYRRPSKMAGRRRVWRA
jgi:hypothetical protein